MSGINKVILIGRLGQDPESKQLDNERSVTNFSVATSEAWTDKVTGEKKEETQWHRVSVFGKLAEVAAKYLTKGRQVYVEGKLKTRSYEVDGVKKYSTDIICDKLEFLGDRQTTDEVETTVTETPTTKTAAPTKRPHNFAPGATNDDTGF